MVCSIKDVFHVLPEKHIDASEEHVEILVILGYTNQVLQKGCILYLLLVSGQLCDALGCCVLVSKEELGYPAHSSYPRLLYCRPGITWGTRKRWPQCFCLGMNRSAGSCQMLPDMFWDCGSLRGLILCILGSS